MKVSHKNDGGLRVNGISKSSGFDSPLVTIITVVYNGEKHIEQTILSVTNQTYQNIEYLIIDGGSTDGTCDIIKKYENKIDYWLSEPDGGIYEAMNKGISLAKGQLIGFINSDDWYEETAVSEVVKFLKDDPAVHVLSGLHRIWDNSGILGITGHSHLFLKYGMISHPTSFVKKEIYEKYGAFNCHFRIAADYELMLRLETNKLKFSFIEKVLANFRNTGMSNTSQKLIVFETNEVRKMYSIISATQFNIIKLGFLFKSLLRFNHLI